MKKLHITLVCAAGAVVGALAGSTEAVARIVPAGSYGAPSPWPETSRWMHSYPNVYLLCVGTDMVTHWFYVPLDMDSATSVNPVTYQTHANHAGNYTTGCVQTNTYTATGAWSAHNTINCTFDNAPHTGGAVTRPTDGTAFVAFSSSCGTTFGDAVEISTVKWTP